MWEHIKEYIALPDCKDRKLYRILARNFEIGVYSEKTKSFFGLRTKFGDTFIDDEYHWDADPRHGTAKPIEELPEELPTEIANEYCHGTKCEHCQKFCEYIRSPQENNPIVKIVGGYWKHLEESDCKEVKPVGVYNYDLDRWIREMEKKYKYKEKI